MAFVFFGAGLYGFYRLIRKTGFKSVLGALVLFSTQFLWFVLPNIVPYFVEVNLPASYYSAGILAFMHCAQYMWITSYYARRELETAERLNRNDSRVYIRRAKLLRMNGNEEAAMEQLNKAIRRSNWIPRTLNSTFTWQRRTPLWVILKTQRKILRPILYSSMRKG